jgi:hypothetical protein
MNANEYDAENAGVEPHIYGFNGDIPVIYGDGINGT